MYKLLIVEDDQGIANGIKKQTEAWGLAVSYTHLTLPTILLV